MSRAGEGKLTVPIEEKVGLYGVQAHFFASEPAWACGSGDHSWEQ